MPLFSLFSSTIPPLTRSLSPFSRSRQQTKQSQRRPSPSPSPSPSPTRAPSPQRPARSSPSPPPSRSRSRLAQTPTLYTTSPTLANSQPAPALPSPSMINTLPTPLICPTCEATEVGELFNRQGHRRAAVCSGCFSKFTEREVKARDNMGLTSFPKLMEVVDEQVAMETEEAERRVAGGSLGRVFGGLQLFGKRRDSAFSEGGSSGVSVDGE